MQEIGAGRVVMQAVRHRRVVCQSVEEVQARGHVAHGGKGTGMVKFDNAGASDGFQCFIQANNLSPICCTKCCGCRMRRGDARLDMIAAEA